MLNSINMKSRKMITFASAGMDLIKERISLLMPILRIRIAKSELLGTALMLLRGRSTRRVRSALMRGTPGKVSMSLKQS